MPSCIRQQEPKTQEDETGVHEEKCATECSEFLSSDTAKAMLERHGSTFCY